MTQHYEVGVAMVNTFRQHSGPLCPTLNDVIETERLTNKIYLLKRLFGLTPGLLQQELASLRDVLDLQCGPGLWALEMAQEYSHMRICGLDDRPTMITHARLQAQYQRLQNVDYSCAEDLLHLPFPDKSFDCISAQFLSNALLRKTDWYLVLQECWRLLRPGGILRLMEYDIGTSNAPAHGQFLNLFAQAMACAKRSFSSERLGYEEGLSGLLQKQGFTSMLCLTRWIDYSSDTPCHEEYCRDYLLVAQKMASLIVEMEVETVQQVTHLYDLQRLEMSLPNFRAEVPIVTLNARKDAASSTQTHLCRPLERESLRHEMLNASENAYT